MVYCKICGKEIPPTFSRKRQTCSFKCHQQLARQTRITNNPHPAPLCIICGKQTPLHKPAYKQRITCSLECKKVLMSRNAFKRVHPRFKYPNGLPELTCQKCGKKFPMKHYYKARYCSHKCAHTQPKGDKSWAWKGGRIIMQGYILIYKPEHPNAIRDGYVREHHLVMEEHLGRFLQKGERVHHVNANRSDNRLQNLQLLSSHCHIKCPFCGRKFNPPQGTFI